MNHRNCVLYVVAAFLGACAQPGAGMYRPDLSDDIVARVSPGQIGAEVSALLGAPYRRIRFDNLKATAWDYRFLDTWGYWVDLSVMMGDDGRVVNKVLQRIEPPDKN